MAPFKLDVEGTTMLCPKGNESNMFKADPEGSSANCAKFCLKDISCDGFAFSKAKNECVFYWKEDVEIGKPIRDYKYVLYTGKLNQNHCR